MESFIQLYRTIDNLFEDDPNMDDSPETKSLQRTFQELCGNPMDTSITRSALFAWSDIQNLLLENLLSPQELNELWNQACASSNNTGSHSIEELNFQGFQFFNTLLDDLFISEEEEPNEKYTPTPSTDVPEIEVNGQDLTPQQLFTQISQGTSSISFDVIVQRWGELKEMIQDGDVSTTEAKQLFQQAATLQGSKDEINQDGFVAFYKAIDNLFEEIDDEEEKDTSSRKQVSAISSKTQLLSLLSELEKDSSRLPCGLECTEEEIQRFSKVVQTLEKESTNQLLSNKAMMKPSDIAGKWQLVYTSSSTLKFNKGISGLVPPTGKFGGLVQILKANKFMSDMEYVETVNAGPGSFDVRVTGDWELKSSVSLFTGEQAIALKVEPNLVLYGITSQKADHWKSLGPMNLLDISYLDNDMRIMRGTTSSESIFIFIKRI
jgi:hypothetical protein